MFTPFFTDTEAFRACQTRRMREIRAEVDQIRLAKAIQQPPRFRFILTSLASLFFSV